MISLMQDEFDELIRSLGFDLFPAPRISCATGEAAFDFISGLVEALKRSPNLDSKFIKLSEYFGENIAVAGR